MSKDFVVFNSPIIEISNKDSVTKEVTMLIHKNDIANANGLNFKSEHVETFKETLLNKPVVAKYYPLEEDLGHHEPVFDETGKIIGLETISIGTFKEVWTGSHKTEDDEVVEALYAKADLWSYKYPEIISCVQRLFDDGNAESSVEVEIYSYEVDGTKRLRSPTDYTYLGNCLLGSDITPADSDAGITGFSNKEIATAVNNDLQALEEKGDKKLSKTDDKIEVFNKGVEIKYHGKLEVSALKWHDVGTKIHGLVNPVDTENGGREYNFYIRDLYTSYVILEDWDDYETLYKASYVIEGETVTLAAREDWVQGSYGFIPNGIEVNSLIEDNETKLTELNQALDDLKEENKTMSKEKKTEIELNEAKIEELETEIASLKATIVSEKEAKGALEETITELNGAVKELEPFKEQVLTAEKEAKVKELNAKYSKLISEETFKSEVVVNAINDNDIGALNDIVVQEISKQKVTEIETASAKNEDVVITASKQEDLVEQTILEKYGY